MTPEAERALLDRLEVELRSIESQPARNNAEALEIIDRSHQLRRDIERVKAGQHKIGHP
jgi:hypothetical protein